MNTEKTNFDIAVIKAAIANCEVLDQIALEVRGVDPKTLSLDDEIWGIETGPIKDRIVDLKGPTTLRYVALRTVIVETLGKSKDKKDIIINGEITMPISDKKVVNLDQIFLKKENDARQLFAMLTEHQLAKALLGEEDFIKLVGFLKKQHKDGLY